MENHGNVREKKLVAAREPCGKENKNPLFSACGYLFHDFKIKDNRTV
jgi:hypothetical protein